MYDCSISIKNRTERKGRKVKRQKEGRTRRKEGKAAFSPGSTAPPTSPLPTEPRSLGAFVIVTQGIAIVLQMMEPEQRKQRNQSLANEGATRPLPPRTTDAGSEGIIRPESKGPTGR